VSDLGAIGRSFLATADRDDRNGEVDVIMDPDLDLRLEAPNFRRGTVKSVSHRITNW
jgi:hypothetical protein